MSPKTLTALSHFHGTARCPYGGGHPVQADHHIIIAMPASTGIGLPLYSGCHDCLLRAIAAMDTPPRDSIEPQLREMLVRAITALTQPMHYSEVGDLVQEIRAVLAHAD